MELGEDLSLGSLRAFIMTQPGVLNLTDILVFNKVGGNYSQAVTTQPYVNATTKQIGLLDDTIYAQPNEILQIRFPDQDIAVRYKNQVNRSFNNLYYNRILFTFSFGG